MEQVWYQNVTYEDAKDLVKENLANTVSCFVAAGYWLKSIKTGGGYGKEGYSSIWELAEAEFGLKASEASRAMGMNDKYSVDGNSPAIQEKYRNYNKSQLQEMLNMSEEQMGQVSPDMTVKEIRQMKKQGVTDGQVSILEEFLAAFVEKEYVSIMKYYGQDAEAFLADNLPVTLGNKMLLPDDGMETDVVHNVLVDRGTGEILGKYNAGIAQDFVGEGFKRLHGIRSVKMRPELKGVMDHAYCRTCGEALAEPGWGVPVSEICSRCGQAVDWSGYKEFDDLEIAFDTVNTESEEEFGEEIIAEIEEGPEEEMELEFELLEGEEGFPAEGNITIIDGDYREISSVATSQELSADGLGETDKENIPDTGRDEGLFFGAEAAGYMRSRLTFKTPEGTWGLNNGYDIKKVPKELYGALCKLKDYEETGVSPGDIELIKGLQEAAVQKVDEARERMCDGYCKYSAMYTHEKDKKRLEKICEGCPLDI